VTSLDLDSRLAFNLKRGMPRLRELEKRFDVTAQMVNQVGGAWVYATSYNLVTVECAPQYPET